MKKRLLIPPGLTSYASLTDEQKAGIFRVLERNLRRVFPEFTDGALFTLILECAIQTQLNRTNGDPVGIILALRAVADEMARAAGLEE